MNNNKKNKGFTLVELLVTISIFGLIISVVAFNVKEARIRGRDGQRKADLHQLQLALNLYYDEYNTYLVAGTGWNNTGQGWLGLEGGSYTKAVSRGLKEEGLYFGPPRTDDPIQNPGYMIYLCDNNQTYAISATLEKPTAADIAFVQTTCNGTGANGTYSVYGKNYALTNKLN